VARVEVARAAQEDLDRLIRTLSLPGDTRERVKRALIPLERFPRLGPELANRWTGFRFILGPWRWLIFVYLYLEDLDRVIVVSVQDARSAGAATADG
jgi:plasmid stabilization system protein ParE